MAANRVLAGASGYAFKEWQGSFYPDKIKAEDMLAWYAARLPTVEINNTFYRMPKPAVLENWAQATPPEFRFAIKASRRITHDARIKADAADSVAYLYRMLASLPGKLGAVLFQFPQWFVISKKSKAYIDEVVERLPDFRVAVEFRHKSWMEERNAEETLSFLEERNLPFVCVDMPQGFDSSIPPIAAATADDLAMIRFHGRDRDVWERKGIPASERFRYDYKRDELEEWVPKVEALAAEARETHVLMNNCYQDFAVRSARELGDLLDLELPE